MFYAFLITGSVPKKDSFLKLIVLPKVAILCLNIFGLSSTIAFLDPTMSLFVLEKVGTF